MDPARRKKPADALGQTQIYASLFLGVPGLQNTPGFNLMDAEEEKWRPSPESS